MRKNWDSYPEKFVIKCNHGCGYNIMVPDKRKADVDAIVKKLAGWMKEDFWKVYCEPQYRHVEKAIFAEAYLGDVLPTYKFYCFHGEPKVFYLSSDSEDGAKDYYLDYYNMDCNWLPISLFGHAHKEEHVQPPANFAEMKEIARTLSADFPFVRVDLYNVDGEIKFSELTFIPTGGYMKTDPAETLVEWGKWLEV